MKNNKAIKEWQRDLDYLSVAYNLSSHKMDNEPADVYSQILMVARSIPEEVEQLFGSKTFKSMEYFLKTTAGSLLELQNLIKISLNLNLISINEYHSLTQNMEEIGEIVKNFISNFNTRIKIPEKKLIHETHENAFWTLN